MKKVMLIMAAALLMLTQCKKENETPNGPAEGTMKMTVTAGPGRTSIDIDNGAITWSEGDKLYVSDGSTWLGSLTLERGAGSANGTFMGDIESTGENLTTCYFFYLGHDNGMTEPTASSSDPVSISFAAQDGTLAGAMKYHTGYGSTDVTVQDGEATGNVIMNTKIAIARLNFFDGTDNLTGSFTMGGTGIYNTMTVNPNGTFSGNGDGGITIGATTEVDKYVTLIPTTENIVSVAFAGGGATGSMTFLTGIRENKFYGMSNAMKVTMEPAKFTVGNGITVEFAPGNLYWDGSAFHFEANQWSFANTWNASHVSHFKWSDVANAVTDDYDCSGDLFCASNFTVTGDSHTWRTLSKAEWGYLLGYDPDQWVQTDGYGRPGAKNLCAWKELDDGTHNGFVILPDGTENPSEVLGSITKTSDLAIHGAVFLPAAGFRYGTIMDDVVGSYGFYWLSTPLENQGSAYYLFFTSPGFLKTINGSRNFGYSVRLVR